MATAALAAACLAASGCGDGDGAIGGGEPAEVASAYVEAIDERDGDRFCDLVAPYIRGTIDLELQDPDSNIGGRPSCGEFVGKFIGYIEDCCPPEFLGARVEEAELGERRGRLQGVVLDIELETKEGEVVSRRPLRDVVWLAEFDGRWRVAKLSAVARAASLGFDIGGESEDDDPLAPPDLEAQLRAYAELRGESDVRAEEREESYAQPGEPAACRGVRYDDPADDARDYQHPAPDEPPPPTPHVDLRQVDIRAKAGEFCVRYVTAGEIEGPVTFRFNVRDSSSGESFIQTFDAEVREDGLARVTSGVDDQRHPIPVPAEVGVGGAELTLRLTPESFEAGEPSPGSTAPPPTDRFFFIASATAPLGETRVLHDDLGITESPTSFSYPSGGKACDIGEC